MVATDVASRGIGMKRKQPLPSPLPFSMFYSLHLLPLPSCDMMRALFSRYASHMRNLPRLRVLIGP